MSPTRSSVVQRRFSVLGVGLSGWLALVAICAAQATALAGPKSKTVRGENVTVQAFADREAVVPGETVELAVRLKMAGEWHVYWMNPSGTGMPTEIKWSAPAGYEVGPTRFPVPESSYSELLEETSYIHEGTAAFLTTVRIPATAKVGEEVAFKVEVSWLACKVSCIPGDAKLTLTLPVVSSGTTPKPANEKVFKNARGAMPIPASKASYVKITGALDRKVVKPGDKLNAVLTVTIKDKHHAQSNKPAQEGLIPTVVFAAIVPGDDIEIGQVIYPKAHERQDAILGKMSEYTGKVEFKIPLEIDSSAKKTPRWIRGVLQHQVCTDSGTCFPPEYVAFAIPLQFEGGAKPAATGSSATPGEAPTGSESSGTEATGSSASVLGNETGASNADSPTTDVADRSVLIRAQDWLFGLGFLGVILAGFIGGFILNLMPCVLPVISLKVLSFVKQAHEDRWRVFRLGLTYSAGIMVFYSILAILFYRTGTGWGALFQNSYFVIAMAAIVLAFSLSLFGVFAVFTPKVVNKLGEHAQGEGYLSAFGTGMLATVLGTACTAPFLSAAISYATKLGPVQGTSIFLAVGFGMAFPIIVLTYNPAWLRFVPKPGPWMGTFEKAMGFLLIATVIWLVNPLRVQIGHYGLLLSLIFLLAVAAAACLKGGIEFGAPFSKKVRLYGLAMIVLFVGWTLPFRVLSTIPDLIAAEIERDDLIARGSLAKYGRNLDWSKGIPWQHYARDLAMKDVEAGYSVFVDYTATWCASCKTNLVAFINRAEVIEVMRDLNVIPYEADYTKAVPEITEDLQRFGRAGVPMYLVYRAGDTENPEVLPEFLTQSVIIDALKRAGPSRLTNRSLADAGTP